MTDPRGFHKDPEYLSVQSDFKLISDTHSSWYLLLPSSKKRLLLSCVKQIYIGMELIYPITMHSRFHDHLIKRAQVEFWVNGGRCIGKVSLK